MATDKKKDRNTFHQPEGVELRNLHFFLFTLPFSLSIPKSSREEERKIICIIFRFILKIKFSIAAAELQKNIFHWFVSVAGLGVLEKA